jgi:nicotinamidase-related amidase
MIDTDGIHDPHLVPHWASAALVTIDVQVDFLSDSPFGVAGTTEILPNLRLLTGAFRAAGRPIVHVVRLYEPGGGNADRVRRTFLASGVEYVAPGTPGSQLAPGLAPESAPPLDHVRLLAGQVQELGRDEYVIFKPRWGAFYQTPLAALLSDLGVDTLAFAGCNLPNCPRASLIEASERDYRLVLATDAVSQASEQGLREVAGIGVQLMNTEQITAAVTAPEQAGHRRAGIRS